MTKLSFVIPCYGSELTIEKVVSEIDQVMKLRENFDYEIITVNDCSPDGVYHVLKNLAKTHPKLTVVDLSKNMGKHSAMMAGFSLIRGDYVVNLDDDGQCPMDRLWDLFDALGDNFDVSMAKYPIKKQSGLKNFGSKVNATMSTILLSKPKNLQFSNFFIAKKYIVDEIKNYRNPYPYMEGLILRSTRRIINVDMEERDRHAGQGNFTLMRSFSLWLNGFTAFSVKPLRVATLLGFITAFLGFLYGTYIIISKIFNITSVLGYSSTMAVILFLGGAIMVMLGLVGEYIGRIYICINDSPQFVIREIITNTEHSNII